jgi:hypothetical protein
VYLDADPRTLPVVQYDLPALAVTAARSKVRDEARAAARAAAAAADPDPKE